MLSAAPNQMPGAELEIREMHAKSKIMQGAPFYKLHKWVDHLATFFEIFRIWLFFGPNMVIIIGS